MIGEGCWSVRMTGKWYCSVTVMNRSVGVLESWGGILECLNGGEGVLECYVDWER